MRNKNPKKKKHSKFRFLLDSAFAKPDIFRKLIKKASVKHIRHDFRLAPETEDQAIYQLASQEDMIIVTLDLGFRKITNKKGAGVFILNSGLSNEQIDTILSDFISGENPQDYKGKATKI